ncbi:MAG: DUF502 domain-containing protein [Hyphomicrobiaceae bacterium]
MGSGDREQHGNSGERDQGSEAHPPRAAPRAHRLRPGAQLRNYFLTGLVVVGPVALTGYIVWWFVRAIDDWVKPFVPPVYDPQTYLHFSIPGFGLLFALVAITLIGALAANLLGRTMITAGEMLLERTPIVRNLYRALKQMFESAVAAAHPERKFAKVGLMEFPSKGIWSLVYITTETTGELAEIAPGGERDNVVVWMPTGFMPPTGFVCIVPRKDILPLNMSVEDAAKIVISAGLIMPEYQAKLQELAEAAMFAGDGSAQPGSHPPPKDTGAS